MTGPLLDDTTTLLVALVAEVFHDDPGGQRLRAHLAAGKRRGADVALLPELPLNPWSAHSREARDQDAELVDGPRQGIMAEAARDVGVALLGGAIVIDPESGRRHNTALLYGADGTCLARYRKIHLPEEDGYWETSHYVPGRQPPEMVDALALRAGIQICSDVNRPEGFQLLAAQGAEVVFVPRATPPETWDRWRTVLRANAAMTGAYVLSANRPRPEGTASIGGPSIAIDPTGEVLLETSEPVAVVELERRAVEAAGREYPGYLPRYARLYAEAWRRLARR